MYYRILPKIFLTFPEGCTFQLSFMLSSEKPAAASLLLHSATTIYMHTVQEQEIIHVHTSLIYMYIHVYIYCRQQFGVNMSGSYKISIIAVHVLYVNPWYWSYVCCTAPMRPE